MGAVEKLGLPFQIVQTCVRDLKPELPLHARKDPKLQAKRAHCIRLTMPSVKKLVFSSHFRDQGIPARFPPDMGWWIICVVYDVGCGCDPLSKRDRPLGRTSELPFVELHDVDLLNRSVPFMIMLEIGRYPEDDVSACHYGLPNLDVGLQSCPPRGGIVRRADYLDEIFQLLETSSAIQVAGTRDCEVDLWRNLATVEPGYYDRLPQIGRDVHLIDYRSADRVALSR